MRSGTAWGNCLAFPSPKPTNSRTGLAAASGNHRLAPQRVAHPPLLFVLRRQAVDHGLLLLNGPHERRDELVVGERENVLPAGDREILEPAEAGTGFFDQRLNFLRHEPVMKARPLVRGVVRQVARPGRFGPLPKAIRPGHWRPAARGAINQARCISPPPACRSHATAGCR
jgi:hypothetical protein